MYLGHILQPLVTYHYPYPPPLSFAYPSLLTQGSCPTLSIFTVCVAKNSLITYLVKRKPTEAPRAHQICIYFHRYCNNKIPQTEPAASISYSMWLLEILPHCKYKGPTKLIESQHALLLCSPHNHLKLVPVRWEFLNHYLRCFADNSICSALPLLCSLNCFKALLVLSRSKGHWCIYIVANISSTIYAELQ